jgi:hypothetical protein
MLQHLIKCSEHQKKILVSTKINWKSGWHLFTFESTCTLMFIAWITWLVFVDLRTMYWVKRIWIIWFCGNPMRSEKWRSLKQSHLYLSNSIHCPPKLRRGQAKTWIKANDFAINKRRPEGVRCVRSTRLQPKVSHLYSAAAAVPDSFLGVIWGIQEQSKFSVAFDNGQWQIQLQLPSFH